MKLGLLITTDKHLDDIVGLTNSAVSKGHEVTIFNMDAGTKLLGEPAFQAFCGKEGVKISFCDHSAKNAEITTEGIPSDIVCGSQFDNANMNHDCDKVIVL
jgi:predicted peroxiredoxin